MFQTDKLFILSRHFLLYMQISVCIMHQRWLAACTIEVDHLCISIFVFLLHLLMLEVSSGSVTLKRVPVTRSEAPCYIGCHVHQVSPQWLMKLGWVFYFPLPAPSWMPERSVHVTKYILSLITFIALKATNELKLFASPWHFWTGLTDFHKTVILQLRRTFYFLRSANTIWQARGSSNMSLCKYESCINVIFLGNVKYSFGGRVTVFCSFSLTTVGNELKDACMWNLVERRYVWSTVCKLTLTIHYHIVRLPKCVCHERLDSVYALSLRFILILSSCVRLYHLSGLLS
jgi:hypothetical protein